MSGFKLKGIFFLIFLCFVQTPFAQIKDARISGDFYLTSQYYYEDETINAELLPGDETLGVNSALQLNYLWKGLSAGFRYEAYLPPLLGFERQLDGDGIGNVFINYDHKNFSFTVGNFYEQFGSGMVLRSYYEPQLGLDNSVFGARIKFSSDIIRLTALAGKNRRYFERDDSSITGFDFDLSWNEVFKGFKENGVSLDIGGSLVHKDEDNETGLVIPSSTTAYSFRSDLRIKGFSFGVEYGYKEREPHSLNQFRDGNGSGLFISTGYTKKGFGFNVNWKYIKNMFFRSDRESLSNVTSGINYLPPNSNVNTYRLTTLYPYATQGNGENGINADLFFNIKKGTPLGGKYGTKIATDISYITALKTEDGSGLPNAEVVELAFSDSLFYVNWNFEVTKRVNRQLRYAAGWSYIKYNQDVIEGIPGSGFVNSFTLFTEVSYRLPERRFIRTELQHMSANQHFGNWLFALVEYGWSPKLSTYISDEWNYDNSIHYYSVGANYRKGPLSVGLSYVRERSGLICVGGICRFVPASNGFRVQVNTSF